MQLPRTAAEFATKVELMVLLARALKASAAPLSALTARCRVERAVPPTRQVASESNGAGSSAPSASRLRLRCR